MQKLGFAVVGVVLLISIAWAKDAPKTEWAWKVSSGGKAVATIEGRALEGLTKSDSITRADKIEYGKDGTLTLTGHALIQFGKAEQLFRFSADEIVVKTRPLGPLTSKPDPIKPISAFILTGKATFEVQEDGKQRLQAVEENELTIEPTNETPRN